MKFFEDCEIGSRLVLGSHTFTREAIIDFAQKYDPQPFHLDDEAAKRSHFGALCASGWHTAAQWMRAFIDRQKRDVAEASAGGAPVAKLGPSPGFKDLHWLKPVYVGDTITYATEVKDKQTSKSRPQWGLLFAHNTGTNQHGDLVLEFESVVFVERRTV
ncbi:MaoC-like dehydratase [Azorhizobium caulinodans ORS 571]|uniref:MaoC-like dehydratase n=1 Tax=Azorhizobium caulinodans (strain ATCC 43989 / DSM 5975 / JCM 20966 / LMG 6465 / NBRC 14845 / NCIMB 13405 / ORS 571) TaxID=438753 RepID=A8HS82_AZOC5|nr:MaoC family dehydratase [Azorhizobium caulinodans]BAF90150.1 MaoC-like dehydratase [Azorhizobium caulinodans ORS 571]